MTPPQRAEEARNAKRRMAVPPVSLLKHPGGPPQLWPIHPHPTGKVLRSRLPPPSHLTLFRTRHAEESAERPHLVTIIRPCGHSTLRKVTVLLNRRGVVSFEQLLLDISEALGFPRWHRSRVTHLYTTHAREVKGVCDFFQGEMAFLALGKARPELSSVQEALEELFPEHSHYRADALRAWEKRLRPTPDKTAKGDSGYSEGTDNSETNQETQMNPNVLVKKHINTHTAKHMDTHQPENCIPYVQMSHKKNSCRKPACLPNHLQRLHVRVAVRERQPSVIGPFKREDGFIKTNIYSPTLCESCLARKAKQGPARVNPLSSRVPLPPVLRKLKQSSHTEQEVGRLDVPPSPSPFQAISTDEEQTLVQLQILNPLPSVGQVQEDIPQRTTFDLPTDGRNVTLSDIERCYEIGRVVGDGNFAVVRECCHRNSRQTFAMKIVERSKLIGREHMMQNELSLLGSLCHPRIVRLFAHHHTHTHSYLVMELVCGGDLFEAISERGKFSEAEAGQMVSDVSEALNYIHCKSIVHRDIKPENLLKTPPDDITRRSFSSLGVQMMSSGGALEKQIERVAPGISRLKLGDFGLAMVVTEPVFTICGTPTYVAPEILCETGYGVAVDVWALGIILYILLCGFPPFRSRVRDQEELFQLIKQGQLYFQSPYWDPISEEARSLVKALLHPDPTVRLTAGQTLLHPWVKTMASICRQGALTNKTNRNAADAVAEPEGVKRPAQTNAVTDKRPGKISSRREVKLKELSRADDRQTEMVTVGGQTDSKPPQQLTKGTSEVHAISPQIEVHTPSEATPCQQKPERSSTDCGLPNSRDPSRRESQQLGPKLSHPDSISQTSSDMELNLLSSPTPQRTQLKQNSQQQSPTDSTSTNTAPQNIDGQITQQQPLSNPANSSSHSLPQRNKQDNPTKANTQNHPTKNHEKPDIHTAIMQPPKSLVQ